MYVNKLLSYVVCSRSIARFVPLQIHFIFTTIETEIMERIWVYDTDSLLADIGGFIGLLGASICSLPSFPGSISFHPQCTLEQCNFRSMYDIRK